MPLSFEDLPAAYAWLDSQVNYERTLDTLSYDPRTFEIDSFRRRLELLGNPHQGLRTIHIAGTRGKGSAALILEALLQATGLRTAVYTSPHIHQYRERIRLDGDLISPAMFKDLLARVARAAEQVPPDQVASGLRFFKTVFEYLTALFFLAARESGADWSIVETGLGGRLDATNVIDPGPVLLTRIGLEHTHLLGDTLTKIAAEKAAILKPGGWGVMAAQAEDGQAEAVFRARAAQTGARLDDAPSSCPIHSIIPHPEGQRIEIGFEGRILTLDLPLFGDFQAENIQNALAVFSRLRAEGIVPSVEDQCIINALNSLRLPGRLEKVCSSPPLFVDGGHCPTAAAALARAMAMHFGNSPAGLIVGMMQDKDHQEFFRELARWLGWQWLWIYRPPSPRAADPETLAAAARSRFHNTVVYHSMEHLLDSLAGVADKNVRIVAAGSLYGIAGFQKWGSQHESKSSQTQAAAPAVEPGTGNRHP